MVDEEWVLMAHGGEPDAYDYLATSKVGDLTVAQLEQTLENSFLNKTNLEFWKGPIVMNKLLEVSRTYPGAGMPIPEASAIFTESVAAGETVTLRPTGSEVWEVRALRGMGVGGNATTTMSYEDGTLSLVIRPGDTVLTTGTNYDLEEKVSGPLYLTNSLWLTIEETGTTNGLLILMAYHRVSL